MNSSCSSSINGTEQTLLCQNIKANAHWNFELSAGGNTLDY